MGRERQVTVKILGDATSAQRAFKDVSKQANDTAAKFDRFGKRMSLFTTVPIAGALGLATKAAAAEGQEMAVLANTLRQSTNATKAQVDAIEEFITRTQNATGIADGELRPALARLVQATGDTAQAQRLLGIAMDVSVARGVPLIAVTTALARASQGNTTALGRMGVAVKDASGRALSFEEILANLNKTMGGAAAAAADTAAGRLAIMRARFADMQEEIGTRLLPVLEKLVGAVGKVLDVFGGLPDAAQSFVIIGGLALAAVGPISTLIGNVLKLRNALMATRLASLGLVPAATLAGVALGKKVFDEYVVSARGAAQLTDRELTNAFKVKLRSSTEAAALYLRRLSAATDEQSQRVVAALAKQGYSIDATGKLMDANKGKVAGMTGAMGGLAKKAEDTRSAFEKVKDAVSDFASKLDEAFGPTLTANEAQRQFQERIEELRNTVLVHGTKAGFGPEREREVGRALDNAVAAARSEVEALALAGRISSDPRIQQQALIDRLNGLKTLLPGLRGELEKYVALLQAIRTVPFDPFVRGGLSGRFGVAGARPGAGERPGTVINNTYNNTRLDRDEIEHIDRQQARTWRTRR